MRNSGECPKCGSTQIYRSPGFVGPYGSGYYVPVGWFRRAAKVARYICLDCGFAESWIDEADDLERLRQAVLKKKKKG